MITLLNRIFVTAGKSVISCQEDPEKLADDYEHYKNCLNIRHGKELHIFFSTAGPKTLQFRPPLLDGGLLQDLLRILTPPPHEALHSENSLHGE